MWRGVIEHYRDYLPIGPDTPVITLKEGDTPLVPAPRLAEVLGLKSELHLKFEGANPTGSFKDRGMTVAVSKAKEEGAQTVICASTGNTSASAAAYAARAGMKCVVLIPRGKIALGKLSQAVTYGARVLSLEGNFDQALALAREISEEEPVILVNSLNPNRIEGQKTGAFEICDDLEGPPAFQVMPVGNAGNITAYWKGYREYRDKGKIKSVPRMLGFQAEGAAPIVRGHVVENPETLATAIRIGNPASWKQAEEAARDSGGLIDMVSDAEIMQAYSLIARMCGIFVEPASAAGIAGLRKLCARGYFAGESGPVVAILTGHGLKDPERAMKAAEEPVVVPPRKEEVVRAMTEERVASRIKEEVPAGV